LAEKSTAAWQGGISLISSFSQNAKSLISDPIVTKKIAVRHNLLSKNQKCTSLRTHIFLHHKESRKTEL